MTALPRVATLARLATLAAGLALLATFVVRPLGGDAGARAMGPLPACRYDDILTTPRGYLDWSITLVDTILRVTKGYVPPDLVAVSQAGLTGGGQVRALMIDDLRAMGEAAAAADAAIGVQSAYRSYAQQKSVFDGWVNRFGYSAALKVSARPGHSEHQLGLAVDFRSEPGGSSLSGTWAATAAGKWMKAHSWEYGFLMSYPKGKTALTCYSYEPWHFRYVGRELASLIHASGLTPREYLWAHFTTTVVPPVPPKGSAAPGKTAVPTTGPVPSPTPVVTPAATLPPVPTAVPTVSPPPVPSAAPGPGTGPVGGVEPAALAAVGLALAAIVLGAWSLLRRGRSGVGL